MRFDIVTIGDCSEDVFVKIPDLKIKTTPSVASGKTISFELGEKIPIDSVKYAIGGSACNLSVGFARLGLKSSVVSIIGPDSPGERIYKELEKEDVDTGNLQLNDKIASNFSVVMNTKEGERTILVYHGWNDYRMIRVKKDIKTKWVFLASGGENLQELEDDLIALSARDEVKIAWNPGAIHINEGALKHRDILKNTQILFLNREEALKFIKLPVKPKDEVIMQKLAAHGPKIIVMTKGKDGAKAYDGNVFYKIDIIGSKTKDATGAGDSFATGFLGKLVLENYDGSFNKDLICEALKYGVINSSAVVSEIGAQTGLLTLDKIEEEFSKHPRLVAEVYEK